MTPSEFNITLPAWMCDYPKASMAFGYAKHAHEGQFRKYTGEPYVAHCWDVMQRLYTLYKSFNLEVPEVMLCAAALHDTVEDTDTSFQQLTELFGEDVAGLVFWLTDVCPKEWGNRATRKRLEAERLQYAPQEAQIIKFCDIMSNTDSIEQHDPEFARTYIPEKQRMLDIIGTFSRAGLLDTIAGSSNVPSQYIAVR